MVNITGAAQTSQRRTNAASSPMMIVARRIRTQRREGTCDRHHGRFRPPSTGPTSTEREDTKPHLLLLLPRPSTHVDTAAATPFILVFPNKLPTTAVEPHQHLQRREATSCLRTDDSQ